MELCSRATLLLTVGLCASTVAGRVLEQSDASLSKWEKPWFYHDLDGPRFTVLNKTANYETREYQSGEN